MTAATCRLCKTPNVKLLGSHIIPELFYKKIYTKKHRFTPISTVEILRQKIEQKGYRENLLCESCESLLSKWEGVLKTTFDELSTGTYKSLTASKVGDVDIISGIKYDYVKRGLLSIIWRMGESNLEFFAKYCLGPHAEKIRQALINSNPLPNTFYPIIISRATMNGDFHDGLLMPLDKGRYSDGIVVQSVVLNGFVVDFHMSDRRPGREEIRACGLNKVGQFAMCTKEYQDLGVPLDELRQQARAPGVKDFYQKHH